MKEIEALKLWLKNRKHEIKGTDPYHLGLINAFNEIERKINLLELKDERIKEENNRI